ncbi:MAG: helix-turn-helix domain-containing protein [Coriobacteriales bacterium]|jgi:DNA-binding HxlR family transcriptional regulator
MTHKRKLEKDIRCPLEYGLDVFGGKWKSRIICVLSARGRLRYGQLRDEMTNVSDAVLSSSLKELMADGMVRRESFDEIPPRVEYSLTERGASVMPILRAICRWAGITHREVTQDAPRQCQSCDYVDVRVVESPRTDWAALARHDA